MASVVIVACQGVNGVPYAPPDWFSGIEDPSWEFRLRISARSGRLDDLLGQLRTAAKRRPHNRVASMMSGSSMVVDRYDLRPGPRHLISSIRRSGSNRRLREESAPLALVERGKRAVAIRTPRRRKSPRTTTGPRPEHLHRLLDRGATERVLTGQRRVHLPHRMVRAKASRSVGRASGPLGADPVDGRQHELIGAASSPTTSGAESVCQHLSGSAHPPSPARHEAIDPESMTLTTRARTCGKLSSAVS